MTKARPLFVSLFIALAVVLTTNAAAQQAAKAQPASQAKPAGHVLPRAAKVTVNDPVTLTDNGDTWTMDNGIFKATIVKKNGSLLQVIYHGIETLRPLDLARVGQSPLAADARREPHPVLGTDAVRHCNPLGDHRPGEERRRTLGGRC